MTPPTRGVVSDINYEYGEKYKGTPTALDIRPESTIHYETLEKLEETLEKLEEPEIWVLNYGK